MWNNRKYNERYIRLQPATPVMPLWIDFLVLLVCAGACAFAGYGAITWLNSIK